MDNNLGKLENLWAHLLPDAHKVSQQIQEIVYEML